MFKEAVFTGDSGLYTLQMTQDTPPSAVVLAGASAMRVAIIGDDSLPAWDFTGAGSAFTVAQYGHLSLGYLTLSTTSTHDGGGASTIAAALGGEVSIDQSMLMDVSFAVHGTLALSTTQATDIQLWTDPGSAVTMTAVALIGLTAPLTLAFACPTTIMNSQVNNIQLRSCGDAPPWRVRPGRRAVGRNSRSPQVGPGTPC